MATIPFLEVARQGDNIVGKELDVGVDVECIYHCIVDGQQIQNQHI